MSRRGRQLPPVRLFKCATPVKALRFAPTSVPPLTAHSSCTALTRRGLGKPTRTGSRGRGRGLRQTLERWHCLGVASARVGEETVRGPLGRLR